MLRSTPHRHWDGTPYLFFGVVLQSIKIETSNGFFLHCQLVNNRGTRVIRAPTFSFLPRIKVGLEYLLREERLMKIPSL
jgi:hypothetical protein